MQRSPFLSPLINFHSLLVIGGPVCPNLYNCYESLFNVIQSSSVQLYEYREKAMIMKLVSD